MPEGEPELDPFERAKLEREHSRLENERWERVDRRVHRFVMLALLVITVVSMIVMAFLALNSGDTGFRITPGAGVSGLVALVAGLLLRALNGKGDA